MIIKRLELQGFKTFPERTKILFHPGITAIVGPNGTGKSNIVDSILWVLGGQRLKSLRGEKIEDVIFNGNAKKPPLAMADVTLSLENEEEELNISHRVFRSGESEYKLNGKPVRLKDILDELWKRSISENKYFVIEQGAIGLFVTSKPIEKRTLLEEAAGTAYYKDKKKQAENKLESSEQNLVRLEDIISEVAKAKNSLQRQAQAAERYRKLRERIRELTGLHYSNKHQQLKHNQKEILGEYEQSLRAEKEVTARTIKEEKDLNEKRKEAWDLEQNLKKGQENLFSLKSQGARFEAEAERETKRIEFFEEKRKKARADVEELKHELSHLEQELLAAEEEIKNLSQTLSQKQQEAEQCGQVYEQSQAKIVPWSKKVERMRSDYLEKLSELTEIKNEGAKIEKEMELFLRQEEKIKKRLEEEKVLLAQRTKELDKQQSNLALSQSLKEEREKSLAELQTFLSEQNSELESLQKKLSELKEKRDANVYHLQALKKLEEKERSPEPPLDLPAALGFFTDLIEADPADAALVDIFWKEEAKAFLIPVQEFLRNLTGKEWKGNFFLLSEHKKEHIPDDLRHEPSVLGLLKARLRPSQKIRDYIPQLQEALLVQNIEAAIHLWLRFPSLNYMTLEGDVLFESGLLKLGKREEGIFTLSLEIKELERKISLAEAEILPLTTKIEEKIEDRQKTEEKTRTQTELVSDLKTNILNLEKYISLLQAEKEKLDNNSALLNHELEVLRLDHQGFQKNWEIHSQKMQAIEEEEMALKNRAETEEKEFSIHQERSVRLGQSLSELKGSIDLYLEKINNLQSLIQSLSQRRASIQTKADSLEGEIQRSDEEEAQLKKHIQNLIEKIKNLAAEKSQQETILTGNEVCLRELQKEISSGEERIRQLREEEEVRKNERIKWEIKKAEIDRDLINLEETCWQDLKKTLQEVKEETARIETPPIDCEAELERAQEDLQRFKAVNLMAEEEYLSHKERYEFLIQQRNDLKESIAQTKEAIHQIDEESKNRFLIALTEVNRNFQEVFSLLFKGGSAEVKLQDESMPMESGIEVIAQPPGKKLQNMALLSGGEKSLTSLAFLFALFRYKPTPFCILDEVDAALDEANLVRFLELMNKVKEETQFIIITHNYKTMEVADYIYGTTMEEPNITKLYSMRFEKKDEAEKR